MDFYKAVQNLLVMSAMILLASRHYLSQIREWLTARNCEEGSSHNDRYLALICRERLSITPLVRYNNAVRQKYLIRITRNPFVFIFLRLSQAENNCKQKCFWQSLSHIIAAMCNCWFILWIRWWDKHIKYRQRGCATHLVNIWHVSFSHILVVTCLLRLGHGSRWDCFGHVL